MKMLRNVFAIVAVILVAMEVLIAAKFTWAYIAGPEKPSTIWIVLSEVGDAIRSFHIKLPYLGLIGFQPKSTTSNSALLPEAVMLLVFGVGAVMAIAVATWIRAIDVRSQSYVVSDRVDAARPDAIAVRESQAIATSPPRLTMDGKQLNDEVH